MKIDLEFYKSLFSAFLESESAHITYKDLIESGVEVGIEDNLNEKFIFHMQLCIDNDLITNEKQECYNLESLGIGSNKSNRYIIDVSMRLSQKGHDFAATLNNKEVFDKLKSEFKDMPFKTIFDGGQKLLNHFLKKRMDVLLAE
ncbi:DUF2513 domain-containing protein [Cognaticolwellia beringensis]|uniref:DUF2513 domain-containing protein n=1 Tax=Cognaticolwellia beringensis TaxID=1967665 RepID=A0A222GD20_9GAMM|nr:DUF2513 domain-containing protein [Cognaticolwellia beringensis]ASP49785.1 DUF2513 domain-containing protein [Cognaticolwellia beringensis]